MTFFTLNRFMHCLHCILTNQAATGPVPFQLDRLTPILQAPYIDRARACGEISWNGTSRIPHAPAPSPRIHLPSPRRNDTRPRGTPLPPEGGWRTAVGGFATFITSFAEVV
jgi:hypothetical protein